LGDRGDHGRVASWVVYRYLAPKSLREWASAGLVQAFLIALYAEMYGFPLTIYLLARFFGLDRTDLSASLWSTLLGVGEVGMLISMVLGYALLFAGLGLFAQGWRELYLARKENRLAEDKLYGLVRHPQYTGLFIGLFGEGIVLARREETKMVELYGTQYEAYRRRVPMFFPKPKLWRRLFTSKEYARGVNE
jgi:protein-S-isoprenylcysteine O-methyltransferase Ste14